jgi:hypothetical protein
MHQLGTMLAMAGPAEAGEFLGLLIGWAALTVIGAVTAFTFYTSSWLPAGLATIILLITTVLFMPWQAFASLSPAEASDPDSQYWIGNERLFFAGWVMVVLAVAASYAWVRARRVRLGA